ncbi:signal transduction histidine-protein kinase AtoS [Gottschalkia purinilytica]|uniref:histidine kinase n=1 Tax=Gottschalkia purinilytica TaxID=1503 RepID=A0A0L0WDS2_GOTPU|nr:ATP-binding protein [Gottschalkia purinilytica]KNF09627.1 signal transduction histidine-protein kinase AtoS [Gottschalkia purinilytica]
MIKKVSSLEFESGALCGILSTSLENSPLEILINLVKETMNDDGCIILICNSLRVYTSQKETIKKWGFDYHELVKTRKLTHRLYVDSTFKTREERVNEIKYGLRRCEEEGFKKILTHVHMDKIDTDENSRMLYNFIKDIKEVCKDANMMTFASYEMDNLTEENFYKLIPIHSMLMLSEHEYVYSLDNIRNKESEIFLKYIRSLFIDKKLLYSENKKLELLNELILETSYMTSSDELLNISLKKISDIIGADFGYIINNNKGSIDVISQYNVPNDYLEDVKKIEIEEEDILNILEKGTCIRMADMQGKYAFVSKKYNLNTIIEIPLVFMNGLHIGIMRLFSIRQAYDFYHHVSFLEAVSNTITSLLERQKYVDDNQRKLIMSEKLRVLGELAGGIAHDFNNILTTILGFSQIAMNKLSDSEIKQYIQTIYSSCLDGKSIVEKIQSFSRKNTNVKKEVNCINDIARSAIEMAKPKWKNYYETGGIKFHVIEKLESTSNIHCNQYEIKEVILNIILNAMDAMEKGGTLTIRTYDDDENTIVVEIEDTGSGMTEEVKENLFEPFFSTKGAKGTGLGLSISKNIIYSHGGYIEVHSVPGEGTLFKIYLPKTLEINEK